MRPILLLCLLLAPAAPAAADWQTALARMPLATNVTVLDETNCVPLLLRSFRADPAVKALVFMPCATDEFWFFHRARAPLAHAAPTLLDAVTALTNHTRLRVHFHPPLLLLRAPEDPETPLFTIEHEPTAARLRKKGFLKHAEFYDRAWEHVQPKLVFETDHFCQPPPHTPASYHFYRHSFAAWNLTGWEAAEAISLAGQTRVTVKRKTLLFQADLRRLSTPALPKQP